MKWGDDSELDVRHTRSQRDDGSREFDVLGRCAAMASSHMIGWGDLERFALDVCLSACWRVRDDEEFRK